jgi:TetR/AcrR family transcriptional repressor of nem operon
MNTRLNTASTREQLITHAQRLIQRCGYNGFSYRDLAELVGIKTASIHYYFPQKEDLLLAAVQAYRARWDGDIMAMPEDLSAAEKLQRYVEVCARSMGSAEGVCMGSALAADLMTLPGCVRTDLQNFYRANEIWLANVLEQGNRDGSLPEQADPQAAARSFFAAIQGVQISARLFGNSDRLKDPLAALTKAGAQALA